MGRSSLAKIPAELRNSIYELVIAEDQRIAVSCSDQRCWKPPGLLHCCRQVRANTDHVYFYRSIVTHRFSSGKAPILTMIWSNGCYFWTPPPVLTSAASIWIQFHLDDKVEDRVNECKHLQSKWHFTIADMQLFIELDYNMHGENDVHSCYKSKIRVRSKNPQKTGHVVSRSSTDGKGTPSTYELPNGTLFELQGSLKQYTPPLWQQRLWCGASLSMQWPTTSTAPGPDTIGSMLNMNNTFDTERKNHAKGLIWYLPNENASDVQVFHLV